MTWFSKPRTAASPAPCSERGRVLPGPSVGAFFGVLIALGAAGCQSDPAPEKPTPTPVRVERAVTRVQDGPVRYSASIEPDKQVDLAFKVGGYIRAIHQTLGADGRMRDVGEGDIVQKDTVLARVNETDYIENVVKAKANLAKADAALAKSKDEFDISAALFRTQSTTRPKYDNKKKAYETARAEVAAAKAQLIQAELELEYCKLKAPMSGVLVSRQIEVGSLVRSETVGFTLADTSSVKAVFGIPDTMLQNVRIGLPLEVTTQSIPRTDFPGRVSAVAPAANTQSRVFNVEVTVPNPDQRLKIGMVAAVALRKERPKESVLLIPMSAVVRPPDDPAGYAVYVAEGKDDATVARLRQVELGEVEGNSIIVTSGVQPEERVITMGATLVKDGEPVRIIP